MKTTRPAVIHKPLPGQAATAVPKLARYIIAMVLLVSTASCVAEPPVTTGGSGTTGVPGGKAPPSPSATFPIDEAAKGALLMSVVKAADAANVCYIEPTEELKAKLTPGQFTVLVESSTEPPFRNAFWNNHAEGVYVDAIDGAPLFTSGTKFDSGTGWPSFWAPVDPENLVLVEDLSYGMRRIEVRAKASGGHLGHLFDDGPAPTGLRYCINSASLRFVPREKLEAEGYGELEALFRKGS